MAVYKYNGRVLEVFTADIFKPFSNFAGKPDNFHPQGGYKQFCLLLDDKIAEKLQKDGWNVRQLASRDEEEKPRPYISVRINYGGPMPPRVVQITSGGRTDLTDETIGKLDWSEIAQVDLSVNKHNWTYGNRSGVNGYLRSMYVTLFEDEIDKKYAAVPSAPEDDVDIPF